MPRFNISTLCFCLIALNGFSLATQADMMKDKVYAKSVMYAHSETAPVKQIVFDDFKGPDYDGGKRSFTHNHWESGVLKDGVKVAVVARYDYILSYTTDFAELVYADKNNQIIETNRTYDLFLDVFHARTYGLKLGYAFLITPSITMEIDLSALKVASFIDGAMNGNVLVANDTYDGDVSLNYVYSKDKLLDRETSRPNGYGYALDVRWDFQVSEQLEIDLEILDLFSQIKIDRAPFTEADANSERVNLGENGQIDVKPVLMGREGYREHTLRMNERISFEGRYRFTNDYISGLRFDRVDDRSYVSAVLNIPINEQYEFMSAYHLRTGAFTLGWQAETGHIALTSDQLDITKANTFGLSLGLAYLF